MGSHTIRFGGSYNHYRKTENGTGGTEGTFGFNNSGLPAGTASKYNYLQSWANFLLGHVNSYSQSAVDITPDIRPNSLEFFGQDSWRLKSNLTLNYGVRWSIFRQPWDAKNQLSNFDPHAYDPAKAACFLADGTMDTSMVNGKIVSACNPNYDPMNVFYIAGKNSPWGNKVTNEDMHDIAPRIGLAWDPFKDGKTSVRAGYGMFYDTVLVGALEWNILYNPYMVNSVTIPNTSFDNPAGGVASVSAAPKGVRGYAPDPWKTPYTEQFSLDVQRELSKGVILDVGYYGSEAHHQIGVFDLNQPQPNAYLTQVAQCSATVTKNCVQPGAFVTSSTSPLLNPIRPYKGYLGIYKDESIFNSNYNSLQVQVQKKFSQGSMINLAYTWSHALTDNQTDRSTAPQNTYNIRGDYGPTQQDRTHVLTANFVYELPFYRSQQKLVGHLLGGWEVSGVVSAWTGLPATITTNANADPTGQGCLATSPCVVRPDEIGDPNSGPQTQMQWFNAAAFQNVPAGQYHNGTTRRGAVRAPGLQNWNLALFKGIKLTERFNTQLRLESFNTFNHTNYDAISTTFGSSTFGQVTGTRAARIVQIGAKFNF